MKYGMLSVAVVSLVLCSVFAGAKGPVETLASETFANLKSSGSTAKTDLAGKWNFDAADRSVFTANVGVDVNTGGKELYFRPWGEPNKSCRYSSTNTLVRFSGTVQFTAYRDGAEHDYTDGKKFKTAISMRMGKSGAPVFIVWRAETSTWSNEQPGCWIEVASSAVTPEEGRDYQLVIEADQSCKPPRARYSVDGHVLAAVQGGDTWHAMRPEIKSQHSSTSTDDGQTADKLLQADAVKVDHVERVSFKGRGAIGSFTLSEAKAAEPRVDVKIAAAKTAKLGDELSLTIKDALVGTPKYQWYRADAAGARDAIDGATSAKYALSEEDYGHWIEVDVSDDDGYAGTGRTWFSDIPVAYIDVDDGAWPKDGDYYGREQQVGIVRPDYKAKLVLTGDPQDPDHAEVQYDSDLKDEDGEKLGKIKIHVRGNSTAYLAKKPYKIKLGAKMDLFGLGGGTASKHWTLLANSADESLMRNKIYYDLSEHLGLVHMTSTWVDVVMNGEYIGVYQLCQQIRVAKERVNIFEWDTGKIAENALDANPALSSDDEDAIDSLLETNCLWMTEGAFVYLGTNYTIVTKKDKKGEDGKGGFNVYWKDYPKGSIDGGYIYEPDEKKIAGIGYNPAASNFCQTNDYNGCRNVIHMTLGTPEYGFSNLAVRQYVWDKWAYMSKCWMSGTGYGPDGRHYTETCDFDTMVGYWLIHQIGGNGDSGLHSRYAYQDLGGKVFFGPAWDFDLVGRATSTTTNGYGEVAYKSSGRGGWSPGYAEGNYAGLWSADPYFNFKLRERFLAVSNRLDEVVAAGGLIDRYKARLARAAKANDIRWSTPYGFSGNGVDKGAVEHFRDYFAACAKWLNAQFATVGNIIQKASETAGASGSKLRYVRTKTLVAAFDGADPVAGSPDAKANTGVTDVQRTFKSSASQPVRVTGADSRAVSLLVYVNGLSNSVQRVASGVAEFELPASCLRRKCTNFISFDALDASGKVLQRNAALLYRNPNPSAVFWR